MKLSDSKIREIDKKLDDTKFCIGRIYALLDNALNNKDTIAGYIVGIERNMEAIKKQLKD